MDAWQSALRRCGERFSELSRTQFALAAVVVEYIQPSQREPEEPPLPHFAVARHLLFGGGHIYREMNWMFDESGRSLFTDKPWFDADGKPIANSAGQGFALRPGATRDVSVYGNGSEWSTFNVASGSAGRVVASMPTNALKSLVDPETLRVENDAVRWISLLFDLAWLRPAPTSFIAEKLTWSNNVTVSLDSLERFRQLGRKSLLDVSLFPERTDRWFSTLSDLASASAEAVDVLLHRIAGEGAATTTTTSQKPPVRQEVQPAPADLISQTDAAELLRCSEKTIGRRIEDMTLTGYGAKGARKVSKAEVLGKAATILERRPRKSART